MKRAMSEMVKHVAGQAQKEYRERLASNIIKEKVISKGLSLITRENKSNGPVLKINPEFEILRQLETDLSPEKKSILKILITMFEHKLNQVWMGEISSTEIEAVIDPALQEKIVKIKKYYEQADYSWEEIKTLLTDSFGHNDQTEQFINSLNNNQ